MAIVINGSGTVTGISVGGLPDGIVDAGTLATNSVDSAELIDGAIDAAHLASGVGGITEADQWSLNSALALNNAAVTYVTANQARSVENGFGLLGTGMTESSGVFTFPSTGYWLIDFNARFHSTVGARYIHARLYTTTDNGTWVTGEAMQKSANLYDGTSTWYANAQVKNLFDVTSTTNCKVKFAAHSIVSSVELSTGSVFTFTRLGDT